MKIQPLDFGPPEGSTRYEPAKPAFKSRFKKLFERQFPTVLKISAPDKSTGVDTTHKKDDWEELEPSSVCLANMVENYMEDSNEKQSAAVMCGRSKCNCFNGNSTDSSDEESDSFVCFGDSSYTSSCDALEILKSLVLSATVSERNLLADTARIVEKNKIWKRKDGLRREIVVHGLVSLGYDASICKSRWEKSLSSPPGEYEYMDAIVEGDRFIIDIDFRSEFEIARPTKAFKAILQSLPQIFVGKSERLLRIIRVVTEAAKQSLKKKGMHFPPWRKAEYVKAKWLSPYTRIPPSPPTTPLALGGRQFDLNSEEKKPLRHKEGSNAGFELLVGDKSSPVKANNLEAALAISDSSGEEEEKSLAVKRRDPSEVKLKGQQIGVKVVAGLAMVVEDRV